MIEPGPAEPESAEPLVATGVAAGAGETEAAEAVAGAASTAAPTARMPAAVRIGVIVTPATLGTPDASQYRANALIRGRAVEFGRSAGW